jgi:hypothetical protein
MHSVNTKSINFSEGNLKIPLFALPTSLLGVSQVLNKQLLVTKISRALCNINKSLAEREGMRSRIHKYKLDYAKLLRQLRREKMVGKYAKTRWDGEGLFIITRNQKE